MLVLSRRLGESVMLGRRVEVTIVDIRGGKVRLGIRAPLNITVDRREIFDAKKQELGLIPSVFPILDGGSYEGDSLFTEGKCNKGMLVLGRERDETIMIGDRVEVMIVDVRDDKVRLGFTAPKKIDVHRRIIFDAIIREAGLEPLDFPVPREQAA